FVLADNVVLRTNLKFSEVLDAIFGDREDVVLTVRTSARHIVRDREHRFHGNDHAGLQLGLDIFTELHGGFTTIVGAHDAEGVAVSDRSVFQQVLLLKEPVDLGGDVLSDGTRFDELKPKLVGLNVDLPQIEGPPVRPTSGNAAFHGCAVA